MSDNDHLDQALYHVLRDESPIADVGELSAEERRMLQVAQALRGASRAETPGSEFAVHLAERVRKSRSSVISRRTAVLSGFGAVAAGLLAGYGISREVEGSNRQQATPPLVGPDGHWERVASEADVKEGQVRTFRTQALTGFLTRTNGEIRAISGICTHMGCRLIHEGDEFVCPCHGAEFALDGRPLVYPQSHTGSLPPLPSIGVRSNDGDIEVWTA